MLIKRENKNYLCYHNSVEAQHSHWAVPTRTASTGKTIAERCDTVPLIPFLKPRSLKWEPGLDKKLPWNDDW